jgi:hypothetical protein
MPEHCAIVGIKLRNVDRCLASVQTTIMTTSYTGSRCIIAGKKYTLRMVESLQTHKCCWVCSCGDYGRWTRGEHIAAFAWPLHLHEKHSLPYSELRAMIVQWKSALIEEMWSHVYELPSNEDFWSNAGEGLEAPEQERYWTDAAERLEERVLDDQL